MSNLETWVKIRLVLDVASVELTNASTGEKSLDDAINIIVSVVHEYFGRQVAEDVRNFLFDLAPSEDVGPVLIKLQEFLKSRLGV